MDGNYRKPSLLPLSIADLLVMIAIAAVALAISRAGLAALIQGLPFIGSLALLWACWTGRIGS